MFDLGDVPRAKRPQALGLRLRQWGPYQDNGYCIVWRDSLALVWCWDQGKLLARLGEFNPSAKKAHFLPETLLQATGEQNLRLVKCLEGVEAQRWEDGVLQVSRWWANPPSLDDWRTFMRDAGVASDEVVALPALTEATSLPKPWASPSPLSGGGSHQLELEMALHCTLAVGLLLATTWFGLQAYRLSTGIRQAEVTATGLEQKASPLMAARRAALQDAERVADLLVMDAYPDQNKLMASVAAVLPGDGASLREWAYQDGKLRVVLSAGTKELSGSSIIERLQQSPYFKEIKAIPGSDAKVLELGMLVVPVVTAHPGGEGKHD